jgi:hypothetical protein
MITETLRASVQRMWDALGAVGEHGGPKRTP